MEKNNSQSSPLKKKKSGRVVASRYRSNSLNTTPQVLNVSKPGKPNTSNGSNYCMTSTPAANAARLSHNASAISDDRSRIKPNLQTFPVVLKRTKMTATEKQDRKLPVVALPLNKKNENDTEMDLLYNTYLQTYFINKMHEKACVDQEKYVQTIFGNLTAMICQLQEREKDLLLNIEQLKYLKILQDQISFLAYPLQSTQEKLDEITGLYGDLHDAVEKTRNKLLLKDTVIEDDEQGLTDNLKELLTALCELSNKLAPKVLPFSKTASMLRDMNQVSKKKQQNILQCEDFLKAADQLIIEESSLSIPSQ